LSKNNKVIITHEENCAGCMICQLRCSYIHYKEFNPSKAYISINLLEIFPKISFKEDCNKCGVCVSYCLYNALEIQEEVP